MKTIELPTTDLDSLEIAAIDGQRRRLGGVSLAAILVSFVHMASALVLFSNAHWYEQAAALGMTALVDWATWVIAEYLDYARRRTLARSVWIKVLFGFALVISMFLNGAYLWANRPPEETLPGWMSGGIAIAFAVFTPLLIAVTSLARGELTDDRLQLQQGAHEERSARALLADTRGQVGELEAALREARAALAQREQEAAQLTARAAQVEQHVGARSAQAAEEVARLRAELERTGARAAQLEAELAQVNGAAARAATEGAQLQSRAAQWERVEGELRAALAQAEGQLRDALAAGPLSPVAVAQRLIALGESQRRAAEFVGMKESTLRSRLAAAQGV